MRRALFALLASLAAPAAAQPTVVSAAPEAVAVTVYRDPHRSAGGELELDWLQGFALISETRSFDLPAGTSVVRFEGVAGGIIPASAIVSGLPGGVGEKNRDARLISPGTLVDAALGRRVHVRRTDPATGKVSESEAVIRAGPDGVVMQTAQGIEALRCSGLPETLLFPELPEGLSARPTLAVTTRSDAPARVTVRLSYLATDFDWQASYVANVSPDGKTLDLFAWLTLANGNDESFPDASTQAVAGTLSRRDEDEDDGEPEPVSSEINARCWPRGTTSDIPLFVPPAPEAPVGYFASDGDSITVTGSRIRAEVLVNALPAMMARQEELGDLKLYRIPEPVTVAAHAQKQVALLSRSRIPFDRFYGTSIQMGYETEEPLPVPILLRTRNLAERHLGLPLPAGKVVVFEQAEGRSMVVGETVMKDSAVGQEVELEVGESPQVRLVQRRVRAEGEDEDDDERPRRYELELSNSNTSPVDVEITLRVYGDMRLANPSRKLRIKDGRHFWLARVPANGRAVLSYTAQPTPRSKDREDDGEGEEG